MHMLHDTSRPTHVCIYACGLQYTCCDKCVLWTSHKGILVVTLHVWRTTQCQKVQYQKTTPGTNTRNGKTN